MRELAVFSRQFATLIASGMPMLRSLYTLEDQTEDEMLKAAVVGVREDVEAGSSVADAMERSPSVFDPLYRSMVAPARARAASRRRSTGSPTSSRSSTPSAARCARR